MLAESLALLFVGGSLCVLLGPYLHAVLPGPARSHPCFPCISARRMCCKSKRPSSRLRAGTGPGKPLLRDVSGLLRWLSGARCLVAAHLMLLLVVTVASQRSASGRGPIVSLSALDDDVSAEARAVLSNEIPHNCPIVVRQLRKVTRSSPWQRAPFDAQLCANTVVVPRWWWCYRCMQGMVARHPRWP